jgi:hypothetical protein
MFESCLLRIYELLSEQKQRARQNDVNLKVSLRFVHRVMFIYVRVGVYPTQVSSGAAIPMNLFR